MPRPPSAHEKTRLTLEITRPVRDRLESMRDRIGADSMTEVIRRALALYSALLDGKKAGSQVIMRDADGTERDLLVPLDIF